VAGEFRIEQVSHQDLKPDYQNTSIIEMGICKATGVSAVAYQTKHGSFEINPPASQFYNAMVILLLLVIERKW